MEGQLIEISELERIIEETLLKAADSYITDNAFGCAAEIYEALGYKEEAQELRKKEAELYEKRRLFEYAAITYEKIKNLEKAIEMWERYAEEMIKNNLFDRAAMAHEYIATLHEKLGNKEEAKRFLKIAGDLYMRIGQFENAVEVYKKAGDFKKVKKICERMIKILRFKAFFTFNPYKRAKIYEKIAEINRFLGKEDKAKKFYRSAAKILEKIGELSLAAEYYEKAGDLKMAIYLLEEFAEENIKKGSLNIAAECCENIARLYKKLNRGKMAKRSLMKSGELYTRIGLYTLAAKVYEDAGEIEKAKWCLEREIERLKREISLASDPYDRVMACKKLAEIYENKLIGDDRKLKEAWEEVGKLSMEYGLRYKNTFMYREAAYAFKKAGDLKNAKKALLLLAIEYLEAGAYSLAAESYREAKEIENY